ncbi:MAG: SIS domain-containing protein, partial [Bacteroidia bacterium]|nr:SIS domain-containing protein [Bacteroidia bacterium]
ANTLGCPMIIMTGGGKLKELATQNNLKTYDLKSGYQPRMTVGQGLGFISMIFGELLGEDHQPIIQDIRDYFEENRDRQKQSGEQIFNFFKNTIRKKFVIVADREFAPVAVRFTQQLQENSKLEGFVNVLPEANHNAIESYTDKLDTNFIMLYSNKNPRVAARFDFLISHLELDNNTVLPMQIPEYTLQSIFDVIYRLYWVSVMLANELGSDLMNVPIIMNLKGFLSDLEIVKE